MAEVSLWRTWIWVKYFMVLSLYVWFCDYVIPVLLCWPVKCIKEPISLPFCYLYTYLMHPLLIKTIPKRSSRTILGDIPHCFLLVDDIVDFEYVFIINFFELLIDKFFFVNIFYVGLTLLNLPNSDRFILLIIIYFVNLPRNEDTCAKLPSPMSSAFCKSYYFLKWLDLIFITIIIKWKLKEVEYQGSFVSI